jgi:hypothetical protein
MQSFEQRVESLTQLAITSSSSPSLDDLTQFLRDGVKDIVRKSIPRGGKVLQMFAKKESINDSSGLATDGGFVLSVLRGDGAVYNPATEVSPSLKGRVSDTESLSFASKYNPVYYIEENKIFIKPDPTSATTDDGEVTHITYDNSLNYASINITNFPDSAEYLVALYAAAMCCLAKANAMHNTLPTVPTFTATPGFVYRNTTLPTVPTFLAPGLSYNDVDIESSLRNDDTDLASSFGDLLSKKIEKFDKEMEIATQRFSSDMDIFNKKIDTELTKSEKDSENIVNQFGADVRKYEMEIQQFQTDLTKHNTEYTWYTEKFKTIQNQYNSGLLALFGNRPQEQPEAQQQGAS